jgi:hypothetical protein
MSSVVLGVFGSFHRLSETSPKRNGDGHVVRRQRTCQMADASSGRRSKDRQAEQYEMVFEVLGQESGQIPSDNHDSA